MRQSNARAAFGQKKSALINMETACFGPRFKPIAATIHKLDSQGDSVMILPAGM
jgi:hypothetical protein